MTGRFEGQAAIVTGAGSGIGEAVAHELARNGAQVLLVDLNGANAEAVAGAIRGEGGSALAFAADIAVEAQCRAAVDKAVDAFGALHLAVNNAGISGRFAPLEAIDAGEWRKVMSVNIDGLFHGLKYQLPAIERAGGGAIVNTASIYAHLGLRGFDSYTASKHAVLGLTRSVATEYGTRGVRINAVSPGPILTPLTRGEKEQTDAVAAMTAMKRMGQPGEIAKAVAFLLSPDASFITGAEIVVDGGVSLS
ncbi:SDR family NAD(P)-dependent oxidoreductase [Paraburkholderia sp. BR10937]|uniref:SDR family NAD(P)-dependent oxidoreductase n=1 Tax=Paraburkholderia sp. BR10937 TaxID=3236994 RepID=UPI0034D1A736